MDPGTVGLETDEIVPSPRRESSQRALEISVRLSFVVILGVNLTLFCRALTSSADMNGLHAALYDKAI